MKNYIMLLILAIALFAAFDNAMASCRSPAVKHQFDRINGFPHGRHGYIVDHVCALANGGIDDVRNMQYQTTAESKIKDRIENTPAGKLRWCNATNSTTRREVFNCK